MAQLQQAMLKQMTVNKDEDKSPEAVKPGVSQLPSLPQVKAESSSIDIADWMEMLAAPMSDLSDGSAAWWRKVCEQATLAYQAWTDAGPMERLAIAPPKDPSLEDGRWGRVNSRAASMILLALHENVRSEMVARRLTGSTVSLLFRLMTLYQPGGEAERSRILNNLQNPPEETEPQKIVEALRSWDRWLRRCKELSLATPDPTILARGLNKMVRKLVEQNADMGFRTNLVRSTLQVDTRPSYTSIDTYYKHLMGECEALAVATSSLSTQALSSTSTRPEPKIKPMRTETRNGNYNTPPPPKPPSTPSTSPTNDGAESQRSNGEKKDVPCKFFGRTFRGCARVNKCPFLHSWDGLEKERPSRCLACGGKHMAKDCPNKKGTPPSSTTTPRTANKAAGEQGGPTSTTPTTTKTVRIDDKPQVEGGGGETTASATTTNDLKEVLADVGKMLKAMTSVTTIKRAEVKDDPLLVKIKVLAAKFGYEDEDEGGGLLDSGASHPMRAATEAEYERSIPVKVTLAGEEERVLRQNGQGTVLLKPGEAENSQPIVPLGAVIRDLGCRLQWKEDGIKLFHPDRGQVKIRIRNNCPEVSTAEAHRLIKELEMVQLKTLNDQVSSLSARLEVLQKEEKRTWDQLLKDFMECGDRGLLHRALLLSPFTKDLPADVQAMMVASFKVEGGDEYLRKLPFSRRKRRLLQASNDWVVKLFHGKSEENSNFERIISRGGKVILEVDVANSRAMDLHGASPVYQLLLWAAAKGKIADVIGSPPETTWTTSLTPTRGPKAIHQRTKDFPFGVPGLSVLQQQRLDQDTACVAKQLLLWMCAMMKSKRNVGFALEFPADVVPMREEEKDYLSFWKTEMWKSFKSVSGMAKATFNQGAVGHQALRPTTIATNYPEVLELDGDFDFGSHCVPTSLLDRASLRRWSLQLELMVARAAVNYVPSPETEEEEAINCGARMSKLTKDQKDAWTLHLLNDHQPYRADCSVCLNAQATGYQHRRRKQPQLYALALDLAGPYKVKGRDMDFDDYKYIMVAAYKCPKEYLDAKTLEAMEKEFSVDEYEPSDGEGEFGMIEDEKGLMESASGGEEEAHGDPEGPPTLDEAVEELTETPECITMYLTRPLRRRTKNEVLRASKEILLQLKQTGLHVATVHTDRAREFSSVIYKDWIADNGLRHSRTAGGDPAGNSTAELGVKWAKSRVRALLKAAQADARDWPMAVQHATSTAWAKAFPYTPTTMTPATPFGNEVWFRSKNYKGTGEKKHDPTGARWKRGWYRGPSYDVNRGHIILREDGGLTIAKSVKFNVVDPSKDLPDLLPPGMAEDLLPEPEGSDVLVPKRTLESEIEFIAKMLLGKGAFKPTDVMYLFEKLEELGNTDFRVGKKTPMTSWYTGAFVHGGVAGLRTNARRFPNATKYLVAYAKDKVGDGEFTAIGLTRNSALGLHRDVHNSRCSTNTVLPVTEFEGGGLWIEDDDVDAEDAVLKAVPKKGEVKGRVQELQGGNPVSFKPNLWHEVQPWKGERVVMLLYTPRASRLKPAEIEELNDLGFKLATGASTEPEPEVQEECEQDDDIEIKRAFLNTDKDQDDAFVELEDDELFSGVDVKNKPCNEFLMQKVTHTVSLSEVRRAKDKWLPSAKKEYDNLVEGKKAFKPTKFKDLPAGCRIVPCKGVFTVKPDPQAGFKRKTRFVACGNYLEEGELTGNDFEVYAAGLDASSLRTMLAYRTTKPTWGAGVTDIRQAFVLAPWIGKAVALKPPPLAVELGLAEEDDYWLVLQSIYGLRESPAAWANFRDKELEAARWECQVEGKPTVLKLQQLVSDNQVWKVVRADGQGSELGYLMVYVDDLMIMGTNNVMESFFGWVSEKWECDDLNILSETNPIKFLGMELHYVNEGIEVSQEGFIRELLRAHNHDGGRAKTQGPKETLIMSAEEEASLLDAIPIDLKGKEKVIKEAQRRVGEMLWLSSRSRPDIQYATAIMSSRITRCPEAVVTIGDRLLDYLNETMYERLRFANDDGGDFQLRTYTDSSFAPSSGKSHGSVAIFYGTCPIAWRSSRQPLIALSTAETELMEGVEGAVMTLSTKCGYFLDDYGIGELEENDMVIKHEPGVTQRAACEREEYEYFILDGQVGDDVSSLRNELKELQVLMSMDNAIGYITGSYSSRRKGTVYGNACFVLYDFSIRDVFF
ncbi:RE1 [Symbiodinium sp. CCMP2592]|nr:RE1 [Symbiodinium sp. CCMP2592]